MKTTLENSYCRPKTEAEWKLIGMYNPVQPFFVEYIKGKKRYSSRPKSSKSEIPVQHFIDLVSDTVNAKWRLIEIGFENKAFDYYDLVLKKSEKTWYIVAKADKVTLNSEPINTETFTDLENLIRFLK